MTRRAFLLGLIALLIVAAAGRALLLASGSVSFHSDEAVVALMARHILDGARPVFFYGQAYMGSLDAWLIAAGFALFGESVHTIRLVQSALYLLIVATGALAAYRLTGRAALALIAGLLLAVPNTLVALYTTATLGGYNETLLLGNLILLVGIDAVRALRAEEASRTDAPLGVPTNRHVVRWAALGLLAGLGCWTNGLIIAYVVPVGLLLIVRVFRLRIPAARLIAPALAAAIAFFVGSAPWWIFNLNNDFAALRFYLPGGTPEQFAGGDVPALDTSQRLIGLFLLGLPAVLGLRYPWSPAYFTPDALTLILAFAVLGITLAGLYLLARGGGVWNPRRRGALPADARALLLIAIGFFILLFLVSRFSTDPTGRYFLPLIVYLAILVAGFVMSLPRVWMRTAAVGLVLVYGTLGLAAAVRNTPPGVTTQFNLDTNLPNDDDAALIAFLEENGLVHGYTNYWIAFRIAFLSEERLQYRSALPYKSDLSYTPRDDRYTPYVTAVDAAAANGEGVAYVTANIAEVRAWLESWFAEQRVTYTYASVGMYHIYYDFAPRAPVPPERFAGILVPGQ
ncbi:MAG: hypothetical protein IPK19_16195 [Chloroflexi bacterium]|nr:hypothetical protein [Chloroflexota bacterium]